MNDYHAKIIDIISDSTKWPTINRPDFLHTLDGTAEASFTSQTLEGYLAAFLIYQQISEDMVKNLISLGQLLNQACIFPLMIKFSPSDKLTFGPLIQRLMTIPHEDSMELMVAKCTELNGIRGQLVHKITKRKSLQEVEAFCVHARNIFKDLEAAYFEIEDAYRIDLSSIRKDSVESWREDFEVIENSP